MAKEKITNPHTTLLIFNQQDKRTPQGSIVTTLKTTMQNNT